MTPHTAFGLGLLVGVNALAAGFAIRWAMARIAEKWLRRLVARRDHMVTAALEHHDDPIDRELQLITDHHPDNALEPHCTHCNQAWPCIPARALGIEAA